MRKIIERVLFSLYMLVLLRITVFRSGWLHNELFCGTVELVPFQRIFTYLRTGEWLRFVYLFGGNLAWFLPLGFFAAAERKNLPFCLLAGFLLSLSIETLQFVFSTGYSETEDLILNTLGALLGWLIWKGIAKLRKVS